MSARVGHDDSREVPSTDASSAVRALHDVIDRAGTCFWITIEGPAGRILAALIESSDDAIIAKNLDGIILSWNRGAERMYGYSAREAIGRPISF